MSNLPELEQSQRTMKTVSFVFNIVWLVLLIPVAIFSFMAGIATAMMSDGGIASALQGVLLYICIYGFFSIPVVAVVSVIVSIILRIKKKCFMSIAVQAAPIVVAAFCFTLLTILFLFFGRNPHMS